ncbi:hypothetical protein [Paenibacillus gansuensis]|uniref:Membrane-bound metallopeptidase n=1 Tax=Paenibacillus gansuensis TaxID=306542 RepID=A0ABW5PE85_9BACL
MLKSITLFLNFLLAAVLIFGPNLHARAEISSKAPDPAQGLLEKSLTLIELNRELDRIREQQADIALKIKQTDVRISDRENSLQQQKQRTGALLRSVYTGERQSLWTVMLQVRSWTEALEIMDLFGIIMKQDRQTMDSYASSARQLRMDKQSLEQQQVSLSSLEDRLTLQKNRLQTVQSEVDQELAGNPDAEALRSLMENMSNYWLEKGQALFKSYFRALAQAMKDFPELLQDSSQELSLESMNYKVIVKDEELNKFLRRKNDLFQNIDFRFEQGQLIASGSKDGMDVLIAGHYTVLQKPKNVISFHIDRLEFNGLELPDTTRSDFENKFDLGFYPQKIMSVFKAKNVRIEPGVLTVQLDLAL